MATDKTKPTDKIVVNSDYGTTFIIKPGAEGVDRLTCTSRGPNEQLDYSGTVPAGKAWGLLEHLKEQIGGGTPTRDCDDQCLTAKEWATRLDVPYQALRKRLEYRRRHDETCYLEVQDRRRGQALYLYKGTVARTIAADITAKTKK